MCVHYIDRNALQIARDAKYIPTVHALTASHKSGPHCAADSARHTNGTFNSRLTPVSSADGLATADPRSSQAAKAPAEDWRQEYCHVRHGKLQRRWRRVGSAASVHSTAGDMHNEELCDVHNGVHSHAAHVQPFDDSDAHTAALGRVYNNVHNSPTPAHAASAASPPQLTEPASSAAQHKAAADRSAREAPREDNEQDSQELPVAAASRMLSLMLDTPPAAQAAAQHGPANHFAQADDMRWQPADTGEDSQQEGSPMREDAASAAAGAIASVVQHQAGTAASTPHLPSTQQSGEGQAALQSSGSRAALRQGLAQLRGTTAQLLQQLQALHGAAAADQAA